MTKPIDAKIKKEWVDALKSGKYEQGRKVLRSTNNQFCCLGVLLDIVDPSKWEEEPKEDFYIYNSPRRELLVCKSTLPDDVSEKVGIDPDVESTLIGFNDCYKKNFDQIAEWIEAVL